MLSRNQNSSSRLRALSGMNRSSLTPFQEEKFLTYFNFFDQNQDGVIDKDDCNLLQKKIVEYAQWPENSSLANWCREIHDTFFHTLVEKKAQILEERHQDNEDKSDDKMQVEAKIVPEEWLAMWERLISGAMGMGDFPVWLQLLPKVLFEVVDFKGDGAIDVEELQEYYADFLCLKEHGDVKEIAKRAHDDITDKGKFELTVQSFEQCFANFILGRTSNFGPGKYVFGAFVDTMDDHVEILQPQDDVIVPHVPGRKRRFSSVPSIKRYWKNA